jgi:D-glycero-alpha-D-manno-heptose 1-phosphate guanylyltransferase
MLKLLLLAGGLGTRLRSEVPYLPKVLAPINGIPFIHYIIESYEKKGVREIVFLLGYKHEMIIDYLEQSFPQLKKHYIIEKEQLGTGGAILQGIINSDGENFIITNGDTFFDVDLKSMIENHQEAECSIALKPLINFDRYGSVTLDNNNNILEFNEKKFCEKGYINGGVYILNKRAFLMHTLPNIFSFETGYLANKSLNKKLKGYISDGYFIDIGIPEDYSRAQKELSIHK